VVRRRAGQWPRPLSWNDLLSPDVEASAAFYGELFGWTIEEIPEAKGQYWSIANAGNKNGGVMPLPPGYTRRGTSTSASRTSRPRSLARLRSGPRPRIA
jgi:predicted enzyme related to lactoylglutathione lyase